MTARKAPSVVSIQISEKRPLDLRTIKPSKAKSGAAEEQVFRLRHIGRITPSISPSTVAAIDNMASVWAELERLRPQVNAVRPKDSFTVLEYGTRFSLSTKSSENQLKRMLSTGKVSRELCLVPASDGHLRPTWCYSVCK